MAFYSEALSCLCLNGSLHHSQTILVSWVKTSLHLKLSCTLPLPETCHFFLLQDDLLSAHLDPSEVATGVLVQLVWPSYRVVAVLPKYLDPTICGWQPCLSILAAVVELY